MAISMAFISCTFVFVMLMTVVYFVKDRISNLETKIYSGIIILSLINLIFEFILCYNIYTDVYLYSFFNLFFNRAFLVSLYVWFAFFTFYLFSIAYQSSQLKKLLKLLIVFSLLVIVLLIILPLSLVKENGVAYSTGVATYLLYAICVFYSIVWIFVILRKQKEIGRKKYYPFIALILCFTLVLVVRAIAPSILLNSFSVALATVLMFFTIENPDVKMVSALNQNRILIEKNNEEKTNLLFKISQEVKRPISNIIKANDEILNSKDIEYNAKVIDLNVRNLSVISDSLLDISKMDSRNIKIDNTSYNVFNLFSEIKAITKNRIDDKIDFRFSISKIVPKYLYGDSTKLKQVVSSLLFNSVKSTDRGFIELDISAIIKYDLCRLMITVTDSGKGLELNKINEILSNETNLTKDELKRLDSLDIDLITANKVIKMLNGTMIIKSELGVGSEFLIIIDQKIVSLEKKEKYLKNVFKNKRILIIDDDIDNLSKVEKILEKMDYEVTKSSFGNDCIDRINNSERFDMVIVDDANVDKSALDVLKMIKEKQIEIPVLVMLNQNKMFMKKHYINDGFSDCINKDSLNQDLKKLDKFL